MRLSVLEKSPLCSRKQEPVTLGSKVTSPFVFRSALLHNITADSCLKTSFDLACHFT